MSRLGKRQQAALSVLVGRGRSTAVDVRKLARGHGAVLSDEGARSVLIGLEDEGLVEPAAPHLDRAGRLRGTWKATAVGRAALDQPTTNEEAGPMAEPATVTVRRDDLELLIPRALSRSGFHGSRTAERRLALAAGRCQTALKASASEGGESRC